MTLMDVTGTSTQHQNVRKIRDQEAHKPKKLNINAQGIKQMHACAYKNYSPGLWESCSPRQLWAPARASPKLPVLPTDHLLWHHRPSTAQHSVRLGERAQPGASHPGGSCCHPHPPSPFVNCSFLEHQSSFFISSQFLLVPISQDHWD